MTKLNTGNPWNALHVLEIISVRHRLRTHAQRALHEAGYKTLNGESRRDFAEAMRALSKKIEDRQKLRLNAEWWVEQAEKNLKACDRHNPEEKAA